MAFRHSSIAVGFLMFAIMAGSISASLSVAAEEKPAPSNLPDALKCVPSEYPVVIGINMRRLTENPIFFSIQKQTPPKGRELANVLNFYLKTDINPLRDFSYLIVAMKSVDNRNPKALMIALGKFDSFKVSDYLRSDAASRLDYKGASIFQMPESSAGASNGVALLSAFELAMGNVECIKEAIDAKSGQRSNILSDTKMASLFQAVDFGEMFWFVADAVSIAKSSPIPISPGPGDSGLQNIAASLSIAENVKGYMLSAAKDASSAAKIADGLKGMIALGQLMKNQNPDIPLLLNGLSVSQNDAQVRISFDFPTNSIKKLASAWMTKLPGLISAARSSSTGLAPLQPGTPMVPPGIASPPEQGPVYVAGPGAKDVKNPTPKVMPRPSYTEAARQAGIEGDVIIQAIVRKNGIADSCRIVRGLGYGLDEAAINKIANQWRFEPGTLNGTPVDVMVTINVSFRLFKKDPRP